MRKTPVAALALLLVSCVAAEPRPGPGPRDLPPPPPPRTGGTAPAPQPAPPPQPALISETEAVRIAANFARQRGLNVQRYKARLDSKQRWRVELKAQRGDDRARVLIDARDGRMLRAKLRHDRGDDWDDWD